MWRRSHARHWRPAPKKYLTQLPREKARMVTARRNAARKWSRPIVKLAADRSQEPNHSPKQEQKPAVKKRPGALQAGLLATAATTVASLPKRCHSCTRRWISPLCHQDITRWQPARLPHSLHRGSSNMEPCTCRGDSSWGSVKNIPFLDLKSGLAWGSSQVR